MSMPLIRLVVVFLILSAAGWPQAASTEKPFCALVVHVVGPAGEQVSGISAQLVNASGDVVVSARVEDGLVKFCDFDFGSYSLRIGDATSCASLEIRNLRVVYGHEQHMSAIMNYCPGQGSGSSTACFTYVRVKSANGSVLKGVRVHQKGFKPKHTDDFGRVMVWVQQGERAEYVFSHPGYAEEPVTLECSRVTRGEATLTVTLHTARN